MKLDLTPQIPLGSPFKPDSTAADVINGIDLSGKSAIVTGGAAGLGFETARALASAGAHVIVPARSVDAAKAALAGIPNVETVRVDLTDRASLDRFADSYIDQGRKLQILVNSAGIMATPLERDSDGNELQLSANHLGHFHFVQRLWPALRRAEGARVISLSSRGHFIAPVNFDDPNFERRDYDPWTAYGQAKSACALFAVGLDERGRGDGIRAFSVHPGSIVTGLSKHFPREIIRKMGAIDEAGEIVVDPDHDKKTVAQGAATQVWCAVSPLLKDRGGVYCENCDIAIAAPDDPNERRGVKPWASDPVLADRLWALSFELTQ